MSHTSINFGTKYKLTYKGVGGVLSNVLILLYIQTQDKRRHRYCI